MSKTYLLILDGLGIGDKGPGDAFHKAQTPYLDTIFDQNTRAELITHGSAVGLPDHQMGGSEVGHMTIGAGRVVRSAIKQIDDAIDSGDFYANIVLVQKMQKATEIGHIHLLGMVSDGGIHSHINHLHALIKMAQEHKINHIYVHAFLDGRDTEERSAARFLSTIDTQKNVTIASIHGRYYAMDRDENWDRTQESYRTLVGENGHTGRTRIAELQNYYACYDTSDYYFPPMLLDKNGFIDADDVCIFWNFRTDRMRQLCASLMDTNFDQFSRPYVVDSSDAVVFGDYYEGSKKAFIDADRPIKHTLGEVISAAGLKQLRLAETEKYNHVTFFMNGEKPEAFAGEDREMIPSPKVANYKDAPEMSAAEMAAFAVEKLKQGMYDFVMQNFANPDLVGHGGNLESAIQAVETVDKYTKQCVETALAAGYTVIVTADHGNCEKMLEDDEKTPNTSHTMNPVPCVILDKNGIKSVRKNGTLGDIAPTILEIMKLKKPEEMTGKSLLQ